MNDRQQYDITLRLVGPVRGDPMAEYLRLRDELTRWIAEHVEHGEIVMMSAGPVEEDA